MCEMPNMAGRYVRNPRGLSHEQQQAHCASLLLQGQRVALINQTSLYLPNVTIVLHLQSKYGDAGFVNAGLEFGA